MTLSTRVFLATLFAVVIGSTPYGNAQTTTPKNTSKATVSFEANAQKKNVQSYIELLRLPPPRKDGNSRFRASLCWNFVSSNRRPCRSQAKGST